MSVVVNKKLTSLCSAHGVISTLVLENFKWYPALNHTVYSPNKWLYLFSTVEDLNHFPDCQTCHCAMLAFDLNWSLFLRSSSLFWFSFTLFLCHGSAALVPWKPPRVRRVVQPVQGHLGSTSVSYGGLQDCLSTYLWYTHTHPHTQMPLDNQTEIKKWTNDGE